MAERKARGISRKQLSRKLWPSSSEDATTARIKSYETAQRDELGRVIHVVLPSPGVLRRICDELTMSWLTAFASAGYYREVLQALAALVSLGYRWLEQDGAFAREGAQLSFRSAGVAQLDGMSVWEAIRDARFAERYLAGSFLEPPAESRIVQTKDAEGRELPELVLQSLAEESRTPREWAYVVPKPMAVAILIAASGFPRRGDVWKKGTDIYAVHLLEAATPLVDHAMRHATKALSGNLLLADEALSDIRLPLESRRVVAAEHMIAWADGICQGYTHYARLASMHWFGVAGSSVDKMTPEYRLPQIRPASFPNVDEFRITLPLE